MLKCLLRVIEEHEQTDDIMPTDKPMLNKTEEIVLNLLRNDSRLTITQMSEQTGFSVSGVKKIIQSLKKAGILKRVGASKSGEWVISNL